MTEADRNEKVGFLVWAVEQIEGEIITPDYFEYYTDEKIYEEVEWLTYLLGK